jgi:hypothetical protein
MSRIHATILTACAVVLVAAVIVVVLVYRADVQHERDLDRWEACAGDDATSSNPFIRGPVFDRCGRRP